MQLAGHGLNGCVCDRNRCNDWPSDLIKLYKRNCARRQRKWRTAVVRGRRLIGNLPKRVHMAQGRVVTVQRGQVLRRDGRAEADIVTARYKEAVGHHHEPVVTRPHGQIRKWPERRAVLDCRTAPYNEAEIGEAYHFAIRINDDADTTIQSVPTILREQSVVVPRQHNGRARQTCQGI